MGADTTWVGQDNWDVAFAAAGPGKAFIFEDRGTIANGSQHRIQIDLDQLERYARIPGAAVYYVSPNPPWSASASTAELSATSPVAAAARCRTGVA
jgi:hypothetical protein